ncbi:MAG: hypothetical protein K6E85_13975 [Lachnospiraceae bacterium]|nr:hypothetical protein [Lachnospiraceae bacterium]
MKKRHMSTDVKISKKIQLDNAGISLIELIVALLILAIIIIPLMGVFTSASKMNKVNRDKSEADTVAENIMEAIKVYGLEGTAKDIYKVINSTPATKPSSCLGVSYDTVSDETTSASGDKVATYLLDKFQPNANKNIYEYRLTGVGEGSHKYTVDIKMDSNYEVTEAGVTKKINEVDLYDLSAFNTKSTVFINPLSAGIFYDEETLSQISEMNQVLCESRYDAKCEEISTDYQNKLFTYNEAIKAGTTPTPTPPAEPVYPSRESYAATPLTKIVDENHDIDRVTKITILKERIWENGAQKYVYKIDSSLDYIIASGKGYVEGNEPLDGVDTSVTLSKSGYCHEVTVDTLNSLYMIYTPFPYMCRSSFDSVYKESLATEHAANRNLDLYESELLETAANFGLANEKIIVDYQFGDGIPEEEKKDIEVYIVIQGKKDATFGELKVQTTGSGATKLKLFSQAKISGASAKETIMKVDEGVHQDKLLNIEITVTDGDVSRKLTSTIVQ